MAINPDRKKGVVVVTNVGDRLGNRVCWNIIERLLTGDPKTPVQEKTVSSNSR